MRPYLTTTLCILAGMLSVLSLDAQEQTVTFPRESMKLRKVFEHIEAQSGYTVAYNEGLLNIEERVSLPEKGSLDAVMASILDGTGMQAIFQGRMILIIMPVDAQKDLLDKMAKEEDDQFINLLEEAIVVGYGTMPRRDISSAISTYRTDKRVEMTTLSPEGLLQGRIAGVYITGSSGTPGSRNRVSIRGIGSLTAGNEPLYDKEGFLEMGVSPLQAPDEPTYITLDYEQGIPVALNGEKMSQKDIVLKLNELGGKNGIGLLDIVENRLVGMKSRGVYETPGGTILYHALNYLETICLDKYAAHKKAELSITYADLVYNGQWFTPLREALDAFVDKLEERCTGTVKLKLYKGNIINAGVTSPYSLYNPGLATFDEDEVYDQTDSAGFINLFGLPIKAQAMSAQAYKLDDKE